MKKMPIIPSSSLIRVTLDDRYLFDPWDERKEVPLKDSKKIFNAKDVISELKGTGHIFIKMFHGEYLGDRKNFIKVQPLYGFMTNKSDYFIIPLTIIKEIVIYKGCKPITLT
jgi:hypothetical protein